jgi:hypothetical protein
MSRPTSHDSSAGGVVRTRAGQQSPVTHGKDGRFSRAWAWLRRGDAGAAVTTHVIVVGGVLGASVGIVELGNELEHDLDLNAKRIAGVGTALAPSLTLAEPEPELSCEEGSCRCFVAGAAASGSGDRPSQTLRLTDDANDDDDGDDDDDDDANEDDATCAAPLTRDERAKCTDELRESLKETSGYRARTGAGAVNPRRPRGGDDVTGEAALARYLCNQFVAPCRGAPGDEELEACLKQAACMHQTLAGEPLHGYFDADPSRRARRRRDLANECQGGRDEVSYACPSEAELELREDADSPPRKPSDALADEDVARLCQERRALDQQHAAELAELDRVIANADADDEVARAKTRREDILHEKALSSEELAESAAIAMMTRVGYACARGLGQAREFDVICFKTIDGNEDVVVLEAKGGSSPLKTRLDQDKTGRVQQGSPDYWLAVLGDMEQRRNKGTERTYPGAKNGPSLTDSEILRRMPRNGNDITYVHVQAQSGAGRDCSVSAHELVLNQTARERLCQQNRRRFRKGSARHDQCCTGS